MFEDDRFELTKKLLKRALRAEEYWEVKSEIRKRLDLLKPKTQGDTETLAQNTYTINIR